ncbi:hypothetical protein MASR2M17_17140 [Aminivibrio sp.]
MFFRYVLDTPLSWGGGADHPTGVDHFYPGLQIMLYRGEHMVIDLLIQKITSPAGKKGPSFTGSAAILLFLLFGTVAGWQVSQREPGE